MCRDWPGSAPRTTVPRRPAHGTGRHFRAPPAGAPAAANGVATADSMIAPIQSGAGRKQDVDGETRHRGEGRDRRVRSARPACGDGRLHVASGSDGPGRSAPAAVSRNRRPEGPDRTDPIEDPRRPRVAARPRARRPAVGRREEPARQGRQSGQSNATALWVTPGVTHVVVARPAATRRRRSHQGDAHQTNREAIAAEGQSQHRAPRLNCSPFFSVVLFDDNLADDD